MLKRNNFRKICVSLHAKGVRSCSRSALPLGLSKNRSFVSRKQLNARRYEHRHLQTDQHGGAYRRGALATDARGRCGGTRDECRGDATLFRRTEAGCRKHQIAMSQTEHRPVLIVIAGPNGSGKTTITSKILKHEWLENALYINLYSRKMFIFATRNN